MLLHAPTPLALGDLTALTRDVAAEVRAGRSLGFRLGHVHDVSNPASTPAVSVHAYSPPLTAMSYYAVEPGARLRWTRSVLVSSSEAVA